MLITAERDGYFGLRAKPALGISWSPNCDLFEPTTVPDESQEPGWQENDGQEN